MNFQDLTADQILAIPPDSYHKLFTFDKLKDELPRLRRLWHPDKNQDPKANDVFSHITVLYEVAERALDNDEWFGRSKYTFSDSASKKTYRLAYIHKSDFELGTRFIGQNFILYAVKPEFSDLFENGIRKIKSLKYASDRMEKEFSRFVPEIVNESRSDDALVLVIKRTNDVVAMSDLMAKFGTVPHRHVAWMMNRMLNLAVFLDFNGLSHQAFTLDNMFVDPVRHGVMIYGGWWYAAKIGDTVKNVPAELLNLYPQVLLKEKKAHRKVDHTIAKALGLQLLGDKTSSGSTLLRNPDVPKKLVQALQHFGPDKPLTVFEDWSRTVLDVYGKREFVVYDVNPLEVYK